MNKRHEAQLVNYLAATGIDDGMLFNFGAPSLEYKHKYHKYTRSSLVNPVNLVQKFLDMSDMIYKIGNTLIRDKAAGGWLEYPQFLPHETSRMPDPIGRDAFSEVK